MPVQAQYIDNRIGLVEDMVSTSSYAVCGQQPDTASCDYRVWTPLHNGYRITEAGAERPRVLGMVQATGNNNCPITMQRFTVQALSVSLSAVGAESPYKEVSTPAAMTRPRRVSAEGGLGEPGAKELPIGDIPWLLVLLTAGVCTLHRYSKCKMA